MKRYFLVLLFFPLVWSEVYAIRWEKNVLKKVLNTEEYFLADREKVRLAGIDIPDISIPRGKDECYSRSVFRYLQTLEGQEIKVLRETEDPSLVHIKLKDEENLTTILLEHGMAKLENEKFAVRYVKAYKEAENIARSQDRGQWDACGINKYIRLRERMGTAWRDFRHQFVQFLAPISVGRVRSVLSGNRFQLENGLVVRLLGVEVPDPLDSRNGFACFGSRSKAYLESLILGERVFLRRDMNEIDEDRELPRYVYLPKSRRAPKVFVNKKMIQDGYGKSYWGEEDVYFQKVFDEEQKQLFSDPRGAWVDCIEQMVNNKIEQKRGEHVLNTDENCPIKGNISGSKSNPTKTYHTPLSGWYKRIEEEACFETEEAAEGAGFRKVK